jgi:hypothetical protein
MCPSGCDASIRVCHVYKKMVYNDIMTMITTTSQTIIHTARYAAHICTV